ncbi:MULTISPECIES: hypothetical protein [Streptomyces]|uniref:Uncharacterized protein n=1 Tax=Streptomyces lycii TaxID=2654337 RepID=A0ABQ7FIS4_9ACTN|nr:MULTISPECIES: hypothetical protein [Streptomyces]KAF4408871.1 hypothetical protein GCU69_11940 [Streptomyces lycii]PGH52012.1 hypothetical protein CRI70_03930 [Streptomyces sp. Ru87]
MPVHVCSLMVNEPRSVPADGEYHILRFPYGGNESYDAHGMHQAAQPDGSSSSYPDARSGLIWPAVEGWGSLTAMIFWEPGDYTEVRDRFVRDPLGLADGYDSTATEDNARTPGGQYRHKHHEIFVYPGTPLALLVRHNGSSAATVSHAQFKLAIHT